MDNQEFNELKDRIKAGNEKLYQAWCQIKELAEDKARWTQAMDRWSLAQEKLWLLVKQMQVQHNFYDCLYLDEQGKRTKGCLHNDDGFFCLVCPCRTTNPYWEKELMDLPSAGE